MSKLDVVIADVTQQIKERSKQTRADYLALMDASRPQQSSRKRLSCGNLAHGFAACEAGDKERIKLMNASNIGIVTAYNDMLSAHQPYADYPDKLKGAIRDMGCTAQVAGGVPAMCDGVTQGQEGMELSLFSRDSIAQSTAIALSHQMFDGVLCLGICDKIVPGLLIGALRFGFLPVLFVPAGPMPSGLPNKEKQRIRQLYAAGEIGREELLAAESASYHSAGTCTFYGTANSNQILLEAMGLQLPGSSFVNPGTPLREALNVEAAQRITKLTQASGTPISLAETFDERSVVNAMIALLASGGSTNHSIHLVTIARAAGILINWDDFDRLSQTVPLLARVYPNGQADINHFHAAGGTACLFRQLIAAGKFHADAKTLWGKTMAESISEPYLDNGKLAWKAGVDQSLDAEVIAAVDAPFDVEGGLRLLDGNLGRAIIKISAVAPEHRAVTGPAVVVSSQQELVDLFEAGKLDRNCVAVVRFQGPQANGMPELHRLTPALGVLQDKGFKVALVTDGRMSGASGKVPAVIHLSPEAKVGGLLAKVQDGDMLELDAEAGVLNCQVSADELAARPAAQPPTGSEEGVGRELFGLFRRNVSSAETGATVLF